jgi:MSHA biogenesis protein MshP
MISNRRQRGFAAVAAIFIVVVLAALGSFMVSISNSQQLSSADDFRGTSAYWSARAGIEWGLPLVKSTGSCPTSPTTFTLGDFSVVTTCSLSTYDDGGIPSKVFTLNSVASYGGGVGSIGYVERSVTVFYEM